MPHFPQQQHDCLHSSWDRRKHLNLQMFDKLNEMETTYFGTDKPTLQGGRTRASAIMQRSKAAQEEGVTKKHGDYASKPKEFTRPNHCSLTAEALQTLSGGSPHSITLPYQAAPSELQSPTRISHTVNFQDQPEPVLEPENMQQGSKPTTPSPRHFEGGHTTYSMASQPPKTERPPAPWLMPWQTGDREMGRRMADAVRKGRTPNGSFANLDLAKAIK